MNCDSIVYASKLNITRRWLMIRSLLILVHVELHITCRRIFSIIFEIHVSMYCCRRARIQPRTLYGVCSMYCVDQNQPMYLVYQLVGSIRRHTELQTCNSARCLPYALRTPKQALSLPSRIYIMRYLHNGLLQYSSSPVTQYSLRLFRSKHCYQLVPWYILFYFILLTTYVFQEILQHMRRCGMF